MFDIVTFGASSRDLFLKTGSDFVTDNNISFPLGSKINIEDVYFTSGGGGTNVAVGLSKQGLHVSYCGKMGEDDGGRQVLNELKENKVDTRFVSFSKEKPTNYSVVLSVPEKDRTILVYRGASSEHNINDFSLQEVNTRWIYIAPFSISKQKLFFHLLDYAEKEKIKVMANPSKEQLEDREVVKYLEKIDILLLNKEEASVLTGTPEEETDKIIEKIKSLTDKIVVITNGEEEVIAIEGDNIYKENPDKVDAICKVGAGDAFASGFLAEFIRSSNVKESLSYGVKNSLSCISKIGAKNGLLEFK
jgi:sugar/nucleoside kinase (ribokinase family)